MTATIDGHCPREGATEIFVDGYVSSFDGGPRGYDPEVTIETADCVCCDAPVELTTEQERAARRLIVAAESRMP